LEHEVVESLLTNHPFTRGLTASQISRLATLTTEVAFPQDEIVVRDGRPSTAIYIITAGSVAVEFRAPRYAVCVQALEAGHVFGWSALLGSPDTMFQVRAREATTALQMNAAALEEAFRADPVLCAEILRGLLRAMAERVKASELKVAELCGAPGRR
jgi:CRP/FNR family transcriptional regulator, cyclic AMP receptor protein